MEIKENVVMATLSLEEKLAIVKVTNMFINLNQQGKQGNLVVMDNFDTDYSISELITEIEIYKENLKKNS